ncbi:hypothetical protein PENSPDRAFT_416726 [Peniophora sp. CONT]|nr:hypothetical protein PENSPDRAFT_416726 [Peniophora sp. CONT]
MTVGGRRRLLGARPTRGGGAMTSWCSRVSHASRACNCLLLSATTSTISTALCIARMEKVQLHIADTLEAGGPFSVCEPEIRYEGSEFQVLVFAAVMLRSSEANITAVVNS